jgi:hypothetical protein
MIDDFVTYSGPQLREDLRDDSEEGSLVLVMGYSLAGDGTGDLMCDWLFRNSSSYLEAVSELVGDGIKVTRAYQGLSLKAEDEIIKEGGVFEQAFISSRTSGDFFGELDSLILESN